LLDQNPALTPAQVKTDLMSTAVEWGAPGLDNTYGAGRLDAYAALRAAGAPIAAPPSAPGHATLQGSLPTAGAVLDIPVTVTGASFPFAATLQDPLGGATLSLLDPAGATVAQSAFDAAGGARDRQQEIGVVPAAGAYTLRLATTTPGAYTLDVSGQFAMAPRNVTLPALVGRARHGSRLHALSGGWISGEPIASYSYRWLRCDRSGAGCTPIPGATAADYTAQRPDVGKTLRVAVTATSAAGDATAQSGPLAISALRPASRAVPTISGVARVGRVLRARPGRWSGSTPFTYRYQWLRCGTNCRTIAGATHARYRLREIDLGRRLRVRVRASNVRLPAGGANSRISAATRRVKG
jgi:hypothetical protein